MSNPAIPVLASYQGSAIEPTDAKHPMIASTPMDIDLSDDLSSFSSEADSGNTSASELEPVDVIKKPVAEESDVVDLPTFEKVDPNPAPSEAVSKPVEEVAAYDGKRPPHTKSVPEICEDIVSVLARYRLVHQNDTNKPWGAKAKFLCQVERFVAKKEAVPMAIPAFPFKSPNKTTKVIGSLPDKGEEVALMHLQNLSLAIKDVYEPGANVFIVSDGLMYNGKTFFFSF